MTEKELLQVFLKVKHSSLAEAHTKTYIKINWLLNEVSAVRKNLIEIEDCLEYRKQELSPELYSKLVKLISGASVKCFNMLHTDSDEIMKHKYMLGDWIVGPMGNWFQVDDISEDSYCLLSMNGKREINSIAIVDKTSFKLSVWDIMDKIPRWKPCDATHKAEEDFETPYQKGFIPVLSPFIVHNGYYLDLTELENLPKI